MSRKRNPPNPPVRSSCDAAPIGASRSLSEIVSSYCADYREGAECEQRFWISHSNLRDVVGAAALSRLEGGLKHPHQRRIPNEVLQKAADVLLRVDLSACTNFDELHRAIDELIIGIHGIGELTVYDIATRVGAYLGFEPERVYLHSGTREGARAFGFHGNFIEKEDLPHAFGRLSPAEIEDCLCIYKSRLHELVKVDSA